jgi:sugar phosphate isomerase/epimerase
VLYLNLRIEEAFYKLSDAHFRFLEVYADDNVHLDPRTFPREKLGEITELAQSLGLTLQSLHAPTQEIDIASRDEGIKETSLETIKKAIEYAGDIGCKFIVVHPGSAGGYEEPISSEVRAILVESLKQVSSHSHQHGVYPLIENMPRNLPYYNNRSYGPSTVNDMIRIIQSVESDLGVCIDIGHSILSGLDPVKEINEAGEHLFSIHADENDLNDDLHLMPRKGGVVNWNEVVKALSRRLDVFILEVGGKDPEDILAQCRDMPSWLPIRFGPVQSR